MSEPAPEPVPYPWLDPALFQGWVKVDAEADNAANVEQARQAAADWIEDRRRDLRDYDDPDDPLAYTFVASPRIVQAGIMAAGRLLSRAGNLTGLVNYGEFAGSVLRDDPDVRQMLGISVVIG